MSTSSTAPRPPDDSALGATFTARPVLRPRTPSSYAITAGSAELVTAYLARHGWRQLPGNTEHELARMRDGAGGLVVLYEHTALVQGQSQRGHAALSELVEGVR